VSVLERQRLAMVRVRPLRTPVFSGAAAIIDAFFADRANSAVRTSGRPRLLLIEVQERIICLTFCFFVPNLLSVVGVVPLPVPGGHADSFGGFFPLCCAHLRASVSRPPHETCVRFGHCEFRFCHAAKALATNEFFLNIFPCD